MSENTSMKAEFGRLVDAHVGDECLPTCRLFRHIGASIERKARMGIATKAILIGRHDVSQVITALSAPSA
jgi:hypothetical protein